MLPSSLVASTVTLWLVLALVIEGAVDRDHARIGVDGKSSARIVAEAVGHVVGRIGIGGQAVTPTVVPTIASSATVLAPASESVTAPVSNSSTSPTAIVNVWVVVLVSVLVARTVMS